MKLGAGIAGILLGILSLLYVGFYGGTIGSAAGWLGSLGPHGNSTITNWATVVSILSWLAPLLTIIGGIVTFSYSRAGGVVLAASAFLHWYLLGFGTIGNLFVLPIGATALLAFFAPPSISTHTPLDATTATSRQSLIVTLYTVAVVLVILWLLGLVTSYTMGGLVHVLLVISIVVVLLSVIIRRKSL